MAERDAAGKEGGGVGGATLGFECPVGTCLEVLLDTGEWCGAKISASMSKSQKYEVMFGDDKSDKARLPVPTDRAVLAAGTFVEIKRDDGTWQKGVLVGRPNKLKYKITFGPNDNLELTLPSQFLRILLPA
mmetsp:Transcript_16582/g.26605  ORF Transcript_16582/g.26605 Transcript_16582/m.26605 type:complete len:131 (-) Transcript_16582:286-678(-)